MDSLGKISFDELHDGLEAVKGKRTTQRLFAAIACKNGVTQNELADWKYTGRQTVYNWLMRLDTDEPLTEVGTDDHRFGRTENNRRMN